MRPFSPPEGEEKRKKYFIIIGVLAIVAIVIGFLALSNLFDSNEGRSSEIDIQTLGFSQFDLSESEITPADNSLLRLKIANPENKEYEDVKIQLATKSGKIDMRPVNSRVRKSYSENSYEDEEYLLTVTTPLGLAEWEETRLYSFYIGGDPDPGVSSITIKIEVRAIGDGEILDNRAFRLTIKSEA